MLLQLFAQPIKVLVRPCTGLFLNETGEFCSGGINDRVKQLEGTLRKLAKRVDPLLAVDNLQAFTFHPCDILRDMVQVNAGERIAPHDRVDQLLLLRRVPDYAALVFRIGLEHLLLVEFHKVFNGHCFRLGLHEIPFDAALQGGLTKPLISFASFRMSRAPSTQTAAHRQQQLNPELRVVPKCLCPRAKGD